MPEPPFPAGLTAPAAGVFSGDEVVLVGQLCEAPIPEDPVGLCEPGTYAAAAFFALEAAPGIEPGYGALQAPA